jgi:hypothetical protein
VHGRNKGTNPSARNGFKNEVEKPPSVFQSRIVALSVWHTHTHTHTHIYIYIYIYICLLHAHFCVRPHVCVCVCVCVCGLGWGWGWGWGAPMVPASGKGLREGRWKRGTLQGGAQHHQSRLACGHSRDIQLSKETTVIRMHKKHSNNARAESDTKLEYGAHIFSQYLLSIVHTSLAFMFIPCAHTFAIT